MSKELTALENIKNIPILSTPESTQKIFYDKHKKELDIIETALKALEIIKEKRIDMSLLLGGFTNTLKEYNSGDLIYKKLTPEEYELLKEVLK